MVWSLLKFKFNIKSNKDLIAIMHPFLAQINIVKNKFIK